MTRPAMPWTVRGDLRRAAFACGGTWFRPDADQPADRSLDGTVVDAARSVSRCSWAPLTAVGGERAGWKTTASEDL